MLSNNLVWEIGDKKNQNVFINTDLIQVILTIVVMLENFLKLYIWELFQKNLLYLMTFVVIHVLNPQFKNILKRCLKKVYLEMIGTKNVKVKINVKLI